VLTLYVTPVFFLLMDRFVRRGPRAQLAASSGASRSRHPEAAQ
jgi:hypothetical protein